MKKQLLIIALFLLSQSAMPQRADKKVALGLYFGTIQYKGEISNEFLTQARALRSLGHFCAEYLSKSFDHGLMFAHGQVSSVKNIPMK